MLDLINYVILCYVREKRVLGLREPQSRLEVSGKHLMKIAVLILIIHVTKIFQVLPLLGNSSYDAYFKKTVYVVLTTIYYVDQQLAHWYWWSVIRKQLDSRGNRDQDKDKDKGRDRIPSSLD